MKNAISLLLLLTAAAQAADWPQWLGPSATASPAKPASSPPSNLLPKRGASRSAMASPASLSPTAGPSPCSPKATTSSPSASDAETGAERWRHRTGPYYKETQGGDGPRSTPTVDGEIVYVLGATGKLFALATASGTPIWEKDLVAEFSSEVPRWGFSTSPLVEGDLLLVEAGGHDGNFVVDMAIDRTTPVTAVALDKATGATVWTALNEKMSYSSPIAFTAAGTRQLAYFTAYSLTGLAPEDGRVYWRYPWKTRFDVSAATPVFIAPDRIFFSTVNGNGGTVLQIKGNGDSLAVEQVWQNKKMENEFGTSVLYENHLYGFGGSILKCLDAETGEEKWKTRGYNKGTLIVADGHLIILGEQGNLGIAEATPEGFVEKASYRAFDSRCWTIPSLANGRLYMRDESEIVCLKVQGAAQ